jgi:hypothetical protein
MIASELREVDSAYSIIEGLLLRRGLLVTRVGTALDANPASDPLWRQTQWLFTPATAPLRMDSRFRILSDNIGLSEYWKRRGVAPDDGLPRG